MSYEHLTGGRADGRSPADFDPAALAEGTRHEREHTRDPAIAREIAMDHLAEDPRYYERLRRLGLGASYAEVMERIAALREIEPEPPAGSIGLRASTVARMLLDKGDVDGAYRTALLNWPYPVRGPWRGRGPMPIGGLGAAQEDIVCPAGTEVKAAGDQIWCEGAGGARTAPSYRAASTQPRTESLGILGWGILAAGGLLAAAALLQGRR